VELVLQFGKIKTACGTILIVESCFPSSARNAQRVMNCARMNA